MYMHMRIHRKLPVTDEQITALANLLQNKKASLHERTRALFSLKPLGSRIIQHLITSLLTDTNVLLSHEIAYVLGQIGDTAAIPTLTRLLSDVP
jgi:deoxyhypusine monooxygenase